MLFPETILQGRYRIIRQLGQGGMGAVYEAVDERLDTTVALKETLFADERLRKQFEREARLLARMHHPALPRVSDHFSEGDGQFLVMQFIAGEDLAEMMKVKQGAFPPDQVLTWGDQLLDALDYLHTQDPPIIHRDIKPQNLKITSRGQIILLDFGLAKGQAVGMTAVTTSASIFGYTPNYAPLEQIQGLGTDVRSDIYSLSATLYHLMTGVKPPDALSRAGALVNGQADPLIPANQASSFIGPEVANVLSKAMSQSRDQRYASAASMRAALKGTAEVATISGRAEAATVIFQPSTATPTVAPTTPLTSAQTGETTVVRRRAKSRMAPWTVAAAAVVLLCAAFGGYYAYQRRNNNSTPGAATTPPPQPSPAVSSSPAQAAVPEASPSPATDQAQAAQKVEVAPKRNEKKPRSEKASAAVPEDTPTPPFTFERFPPTPPNPNVNGDLGVFERQRRVPTVRNLPDGSQLIVHPNGTRVLISPNGTSRVLRRGERLQPRKY